MVEWKPDEQFLVWLEDKFSRGGFLDVLTAVSAPDSKIRTIADYVEVYRKEDALERAESVTNEGWYYGNLANYLCKHFDITQKIDPITHRQALEEMRKDTASGVIHYCMMQFAELLEEGEGSSYYDTMDDNATDEKVRELEAMLSE